MSLRARLNLSGQADPLFLVDGTSFLYRGFYGYPDLKRSDGLPTNAIFIVLRILLRILKEERPRYLGFFMDGRGPTFRNAMFEPYKAQRPRMPEDLAVQIEPLREAVQLLGLSLTVSDGIEADDCIASLASTYQAERPVVLVASDKDLKQCLTPSVYLWDPAGKAEKLTSAADFTAELGIEPAQWPDLQALMGDSSDNIPGLPGVGPKTALKVIHDFPTLEALREAEERGDKRLPESFRKKLAGRMDDVFLYRELTRLKTDACRELTLDALAVREPDAGHLAEFLRAYEFKSLLREIPLPRRSEAEEAREAQPASADYTGPAPWEGQGGPLVTPAAPALGPASGVLPGVLPGRPMGAPAIPASTSSFAAFGPTSQANPTNQANQAGPGKTKSKDASPGQLPLFAMAAAPAAAAGPSLLDLTSVAPAAPVAPLPLRHVSDASALPDFSGRVVGLVPFAEAGSAGEKAAGQAGARAGFRIALEGEGQAEIAFAGPGAMDEALAPLLARAAEIAAPSLQDLLRRSRAWEAVPLSRWFDLGLAAYLLNPEDRNYSFERLRLALFIAPDPLADPDLEAAPGVAEAPETDAATTGEAPETDEAPETGEAGGETRRTPRKPGSRGASQRRTRRLRDRPLWPAGARCPGGSKTPGSTH